MERKRKKDTHALSDMNTQTPPDTHVHYILSTQVYS